MVIRYRVTVPMQSGQEKVYYAYLRLFFCTSVETKHSTKLDQRLGSVTTDCNWIMQKIKQMEHITNNLPCQLVSWFKPSMICNWDKWAIFLKRTQLSQAACSPTQRKHR